VSKSDVVREHIETENRHDMQAMLATLIDEEPVRDEVYGEVYQGSEEVAKRYVELWEAFPDFNVSPTQLIEDDVAVAMTADYTGTCKGPYNGKPPTGKSFKVRLVVIFQFEGDKIESETIYFDQASQLRQLGLT
jgi:steroid delta-isomerase-like uncharacterized protein